MAETLSPTGVPRQTSVTTTHGSNRPPPHDRALSAAVLPVAFPIYPLGVGYANDLVVKKRAAEVSSGRPLTCSAGAMIGPLAASTLTAAFGAPSLFTHTALAHGAIAIVTLVRVPVRAKLPVRRNAAYPMGPHATPPAFKLDPRAADFVEQQSPRDRSWAAG